MSTPAGWYDDGSGRQRWWDGSQWTDQYAPGADAGTGGASSMATPSTPYVAAQYAAPQYAAPGYAPALTPVAPRRPPTLGFVGLGLAALGTALACTPLLVTFVLGALVLIAAFIVSLIAVFRKNTAKWPSIVGICLSIIGGIVGAIVFTAVVIFTLTTAIIDAASSPFPTSTFSEQPSDPPSTGDSAGRPEPEAIGTGYVAGLRDAADLERFTTPEAQACIGQALYDSDLSDGLLRHIAAGEVITEDVAGDETAALKSVLFEAGMVCVPQE
jgi:hypothetical protein